jgi:hypothetical protein
METKQIITGRMECLHEEMVKSEKYYIDTCE